MHANESEDVRNTQVDQLPIEYSTGSNSSSFNAHEPKSHHKRLIGYIDFLGVFR